MSKGMPAGGPFRAAAGLHESLAPEAVREARRALVSYCLDLGHCTSYVAIIEEASELIAKTRIYDLAWDDSYEGMDKPILGAVRRLASFYSMILAGFAAGQADSVVVEAVKSYRGEEIDLEKGDVAIVDLASAAGLVAAGIARPAESNALKLLARRRVREAGQGGG